MAVPLQRIWLVLAGKSSVLILITRDGERRYGPGDWYHLDANQPHAARFEQDTAEVEFWFDQT